MENDLIRRSNVIQVFNELLKSPYASNKDSRDALKLARGVFQDDVPKWLSIPAVDAVEVRRGEWVEDKYGFKCSVCKKRVKASVKPYGAYLSNYCGECGARMDGNREDCDA